MPRKQAEAVAEAETEALGECVLANLATKGDIAEVKSEIAKLDQRISGLKGEIADLRGELKGEIAQLDQRISGLKSEIAEVKGGTADLRGQLGGIDARFEKMEKDFSVRFEHMERKFTLYFTVILFTVIFFNQDALALLARLFGLIR